MNKQILTDIVNSILGLSKKKKKEFVELLHDSIKELQQQLPIEIQGAKDYTDDKIQEVDNKVQEVKDYTNDKVQGAKDYADTLIRNLINGAPEAYDTLKELADALQDNTVLEQILTSLGNKLDKTEYLNSDWNENDNTKKSYIQNRTHYATKETDFVSGQIEFKRNLNEFTFDLYVDGVLKEKNVDIEQCAMEIYTSESDLSGGWGSNTDKWFSFPLHYDSAQDNIYYTIRNRTNFTKSGTDPIVYSINITPGTSRISYPKTTFYKLDERYIPDSIINKLAALEQAVIALGGTLNT